MKKVDEPVVVEQIFNTSVDKLWNAITRHEEMKQWFFDNIKEFKAEAGFKTKFPVQSGVRVFTHLWKIVEVVPFQKIIYNWKYEEYPGDSFVTFELFEQGDQVRLKLTTDIVKDFPDDIPEFSRESCVGGWNYFIRGNLKSYMAGKQ